MRKFICLFVYFFVFFGVFGKTKEIKPLEFSEVIQVENLSKEDLFNKIRIVLVDCFKSSNDVIQLADKDLGIIKGRFYLDEISGLNRFMTFNLFTIETKDNKYRITIKNEEVRKLNAMYKYGADWSAGDKTDLDKDSKVGKKFITDFENFSNNIKNAVFTKNDDF